MQKQQDLKDSSSSAEEQSQSREVKDALQDAVEAQLQALEALEQGQDASEAQNPCGRRPEKGC